MVKLRMSDSSSVYSESDEDAGAGCVRVSVELEPSSGVPPEMCEFLSGEEFAGALPWLLRHKGFAWCRANCRNMVGAFPELGEEEEGEGEGEAKLAERLAGMNLGGAVGTSGGGGGGGGGSKLTVTQTRKKEAKGGNEVTIERNARNKRKCTTHVRGLDLFGVALGDAAKQFKKKFACGCAVVTSPDSKEEVVIQGDVVDDVAEYVVEKLGVDGKYVYTVEGKTKSRYG